MKRSQWGAGALAGVLLAWMLFGPIPSLPTSQSQTILDRRGEVLYQPITTQEWLNEVPPNVARATLAAEDRRFRYHLGIDPIAVTRAAWHDVKRRAIVEGGSTITQQVAKMLLDSPDRGVIAKVHEAIVAVRLERRYSKRAILAMYVNLAPYGNQIRGIARASRRYFGCAPEDLTPAQSAFLASLPRRPGDVKRALQRQQRVAPGERLRFAQNPRPVLAQHFIERVLEQSHAPRIETTLDARLQRTVQGIIAAHRDELLRHNAHSVAVAVLDNATGEWLAWEGSGDYFGGSFGGAIDGVVALRQPGSAMKPFTYALAFERGDSPATVLADVPQSFPTAEEGVVYTPRNYDGLYRGPLRARAALAGSENVPAVALLSRVGPPSLLRFLRHAGFNDLEKTADYYGLGLTLGDAEVRLQQLVAGYSIFARRGTWLEPSSIKRATPQAKRVLSPRTSFWITDILSDSAAREFIFGSGGSLDFPFPVAVKTGTSQAYRDNWTIGYTRDVTVGVWVGNFDRSELRNSTGVTGAGPIFHEVMLAAAKHRDQTIVDPPPNVERAPVCALSGLRPSIYCPNVESEWIASDAPVEFCSWHHRDSTTLPAEYAGWRHEGRASTRPPAVAQIKIANPPNGATYLIDPTLRRQFQTLSFRAVARSRVTWSVDNRKTEEHWPLAPGIHTIAAVDDDGHRDEVRIYVK